ncbi:UNVERIFIED_ORG: DUF2382 domain-containing protein [Bacillus sp. AZ43]
MLDERQVSAAIGSTAYDADGRKIGTVEHFYLDDRTGAPSWVAVTTGLFGTRQSVVPALEATFTDGTLRLPVAAETVKSAPHLAGEHLSPDEEEQLRRHYGAGTGTAPPAAEPAVAASDASPAAAREAQPTVEMPAAARPPAPADDGAMVRSEEQLRVGTERVATTRARLVKYVVTEEVQITVPVRREEIRVEHVPVDAPDDGPGETLVADEGRAADATGLPAEIILHTERPVVSVEVVPTERVRLRTELVEGQETVTGQVQREEIVLDQDGGPRRG